MEHRREERGLGMIKRKSERRIIARRTIIFFRNVSLKNINQHILQYLRVEGNKISHKYM